MEIHKEKFPVPNSDTEQPFEQRENQIQMIQARIRRLAKRRDVPRPLELARKEERQLHDAQKTSIALMSAPLEKKKEEGTITPEEHAMLAKLQWAQDELLERENTLAFKIHALPRVAHELARVYKQQQKEAGASITYSLRGNGMESIPKEYTQETIDAPRYKPVQSDAVTVNISGPKKNVLKPTVVATPRYEEKEFDVLDDFSKRNNALIPPFDRENQERMLSKNTEQSTPPDMFKIDLSPHQPSVALPTIADMEEFRKTTPDEKKVLEDEDIKDVFKNVG